MAIIIEEEKNRSNLVRILGWMIVVGIVLASVYYIFFAAPELVIISPSGNLSQIAPIADQNLKADDVLNSAAFKALQQPTIATQVSTSTGGRPNPFLAP